MEIIPFIGIALFGFLIGGEVQKDKIKSAEPIVIDKELYNCHRKHLSTCKWDETGNKKSLRRRHRH